MALAKRSPKNPFKVSSNTEVAVKLMFNDIQIKQIEIIKKAAITQLVNLSLYPQTSMRRSYFLLAGDFFTSMLKEFSFDLDIYIKNSFGAVRFFNETVIKLSPNTPNFFKLPVSNGFVNQVAKVPLVFSNRYINYHYTNTSKVEDIIPQLEYLHLQVFLYDYNLYISPLVYECCEKMILIHNKEAGPVNLERQQKYLDRGFQLGELKDGRPVIL